MVRLVVDWSQGTADADPNFNETNCGEKVSDFNNEDIITKLNSKAQTNGLWAMGINGYPVFAHQTNMVLADYSSIEEAKANEEEE